jgi:hypothetical protein
VFESVLRERKFCSSMEIFIAVGRLGDWDFTQGFSTKEVSF